MTSKKGKKRRNIASQKSVQQTKRSAKLSNPAKNVTPPQSSTHAIQVVKRKKNSKNNWKVDLLVDADIPDSFLNTLQRYQTVHEDNDSIRFTVQDSIYLLMRCGYGYKTILRVAGVKEKFLQTSFLQMGLSKDESDPTPGFKPPYFETITSNNSSSKHDEKMQNTSLPKNPSSTRDRTIQNTPLPKNVDAESVQPMEEPRADKTECAQESKISTFMKTVSAVKDQQKEKLSKSVSPVPLPIQSNAIPKVSNWLSKSKVELSDSDRETADPDTIENLHAPVLSQVPNNRPASPSPYLAETHRSFVNISAFESEIHNFLHTINEQLAEMRDLRDSNIYEEASAFALKVQMLKNVHRLFNNVVFALKSPEKRPRIENVKPQDPATGEEKKDDTLISDSFIKVRKVC
ncbi:uncharacterized protein KNAG_0E00660 [Huiozyma naganishii CBS 8797]|uniref:Uncharacterized protein n=1 Tax=Huiozyma naganishii (strain ATCC MYA-139 / BCRC 22969 / CBS 8797 / KCTC 17520 / NBRC 10181 / NCYC 3082 / Yp74L-3) TaxID=1071383 RepID=J7S6E0_HUIN7|nr:hypothetical protein KNAG_0E00660 [Kazachstania naganishii CBS 8797]CCK70334.1 hypothetical protein KNAG_0E00660 [Kazachstania naganishii CBS 8797]